MKIGILTFHRAFNYGAVLQCYALQEYLKKQGHEVYVIDYRQSWIEKFYQPMNLYRIFKALLHPLHFLNFAKKEIKRAPYLKANRPRFRNFTEKYLNLTEPCSKDCIPQNFDVYFIGSDQLWNKALTGGKLDDVYTGYFEHSDRSRVLGYAISASAANLREISSSQLKDIVGNFSALSVREKSVGDIIEQKTGIKPWLVLDPTLLVETAIWDKMINDKWADRNFILFYHFRLDPVNPNKLKDSAVQLAKSMNCELIDLTRMTYPPEDFVSMFKYAKCVVTSSFHATAFSLIFKRPLYPMVMGTHSDDRYVNLLNELGYSDFLVCSENELTVRNFDYSECDNRLNLLRQKSICYINNVLNF